METSENLTRQEIEQLCRAYMDCQLSKRQEKELELVLLSTDLASPIIADVRALMGLSTLIALSDHKAKVKKKSRLHLFRYSGIAACIAMIVFCSVYILRNDRYTESTGDLYVCVDGKVLTGHTARMVMTASEQQTMNMFLSIVRDVKKEQHLNEQYINSIMN